MRPHIQESHVRTDNDQDSIAEPEDLEDLVNVLTAKIGQTCLPQSTEIRFWDAQIIAERRYIDERTNKQETDYLVEALPIWRRHGSRLGVDETHLKSWEELSSDQTRVFEADIDHFEITMHRRHPIFEQYTAAEEIFKRGLQSSGDDYDETKPMQMLGFMIRQCLQEKVEDENMLTELAVTVCYGLMEDEVRDSHRVLLYGRNFLAQLDVEQRCDFAATLLADQRALTFDAWTIALCIAILPEEEFLQQWKEDSVFSLRENAQRSRLKEYRAAITSFLDEYHEKTQGSLSFTKTLRTFDTLVRLLKEDVDGVTDVAKVPYAVHHEVDDAEEEEQEEHADVRSQQDLLDMDEISHHQEHDESVVDHDEEGDESESDTEEAQIRQIRKAGMTEAARSANLKRTTRAEKRMSDEEAESSSSSRSRRTRLRH